MQLYSHIPSHTHAYSLTLIPHSLSHTNAPIHSLLLPYSSAPSLTFTHSLTLPPTHTHTHSPSHTHTLTLPHPPPPPPPPHTHSLSLPHSLTHTHSLSLPHSLTLPPYPSPYPTDVKVWDVLTELVEVCTAPCPTNPFDVDLDYFHSLPLPERALASAAVISFLQKIVSSGPHPYDRRGKHPFVLCVRRTTCVYRSARNFCEDKIYGIFVI